MPMTQADIYSHYETEWKRKSDKAEGVGDLSYSAEFHDAVIYPRYERLIADLGMRVDGGRVLDVGAGSGRWIRYFLDRFAPLRLVGIDYTTASIDLLRKWSPDAPGTSVEFKVADITQPDLNLGEQFDLVNIANVLFHIPEPELFAQAMVNLSRLVAPDGCIVTTEYMPRMTMRTDWMLVRSRYEFERIVNVAGLRIADIRPCLFLGSAVMGIDGPENSLRARFQGISATMASILKSDMEEASRQYFMDFFTELDDVLIEFCKERIAPVDLPGAKFVVLKRKS